MLSLHYRQLLTKSEIFEKQPARTAEESEDRTRQEYKRVYHARLLSQFACGTQRHIVLKLQADRILANDSCSPAAMLTSPSQLKLDARRHHPREVYLRDRRLSCHLS